MNIVSRRKLMLWPLCLMFVVPCRAQPAAIEPAPAVPADPLQDAHFSLLLRDVPLRRMLKLLEDTAGLQFRYAALPDARVTASFNNAPLLPTLEDVLQTEGFTMLRDGRDVWLLRAETSILAAPVFAPARTPAAARAIVSSSTTEGPLNVWSVWNRAQAPRSWTTLEAPVAPRVVPAPAAPGQGWRRAVLQLEADAPTTVASAGASITSGQATIAEQSPGVAILATPSSDGRVYLRYPLQMRDKVDGGFGAARLLLETPFDATLYVNGAPLLRAWKGRRVIDLSRVLNPGLNTLALSCDVVSPGAPAESLPQQAPAQAPAGDAAQLPRPIVVLRYEWLFDAPHDLPQAGQERIG